MRKPNLKEMTIDQLVERFAEIGIAQDDALWGSKYAMFNRLFDQMNEVDEELRSRGLGARLALLRLYNHRNIQVRLKAAKRTLGVAPIEARKLIEDVSKSGFYPQAGDAGMTLRALDEGIFKPD
jgi:UTP-glucose-1-phosphate uridylyltransferase